MRRVLGIWLLCLTSPLVAQQAPPSAEELIRQMSANLASLESFRFSATVGFDEVPLPEVKVKYAGSMEVALRRPGQLRVSYKDEQVAREVWIDGDTVSVLAPAEGLWAAAPAEASVEATLDRFAAEYGVSLPLDDLLRHDPYSVMMAGAKASRYVGPSEIQGVPCHHLIVGQEDIVWQIWIEAGDRGLPRQVVITYKTLPMAPEFIAVLKNWELDPDLTDASFQPEIPGTAARIDFRALKETRP